MGMSASQVRFLSLQNRKHSITNQLSTLSNRKLALSRDMNAVSRKYTNALNQINLRWSNNNGVNTVALSYDLMMKPNDINTEMPYMITDHHGRVVVDDEKVWFDKENCRLLKGSEVPEGKGISYREVAELISTYSGLVGETIGIDADGNIIVGTGEDSSFRNVDNLYTDSNTGFFSGGKSMVKDAWKIMNGIEDFDFNNNLRYVVFQKMGLISQADQERFNEILIELYGSQAAKDEGYNIKTNSREGILAASETDGIYGQLVTGTGGTFSLNDGCAMGNLSLAKKYLEEYQIFMNTPLKMSLTETDTDRMGVNLDAYSYASISDASAGVTNRLMSLLTTSTVTSDTDLVNSDGIYMKGKNPLSILGSIAGSSFKYGTDNAVGLYKSNGEKVDSDHVSWEELFNGGYFVNINEFYTKSNYQIWNPTGNLANVVGTIRSALASAADMGQGGIMWSDEAADYAYYMTIAKFANNIDLLKSRTVGSNTYEDGSYEAIRINIENAIHNNNDNSVKSQQYGRGRGDDEIADAIAKANNINGVGSYRDTKPDNEENMVNLRNLMNTYVTFYNAYIENNGVPEITWKYGKSIFSANEIGEELDCANASINSFYQFSPTDADNSYSENLSNFTDSYNNSTGEAGSDNLDDYFGIHLGAFNYIKNHDGYDAAAYNALDADSKKEINKFFAIKKDSNGVYLTDSDGEYIPDFTDFDQESFNSMKKDINSTLEVKTYEIDHDRGITAEETIVRGNDGKTRSKVVTFTNCQYSRYEEYYDDNGQCTGSKLFMAPENSSSWIDGANAGTSHHHHQKGLDFLVCEIKSPTGNNYHIGQYSTNDPTNGSLYTDYIMVKPQDPAGIGQKLQALVDECQERVDQLLEELQNAFSGMEGKFMQYFDALFERVAENGWTYDPKVEKAKNSNAANYLDAMLQNNMYMVTQTRELNSVGKYQYTTLIAQNVKKIYQVHDENAENVAFSEYEADKAAIQSKEKIIDARMQRLETEQEAINTEMDSIKKVRNENIEKTFKIFA